MSASEQVRRMKSMRACVCMCGLRHRQLVCSHGEHTTLCVCVCVCMPALDCLPVLVHISFVYSFALFSVAASAATVVVTVVVVVLYIFFQFGLCFFIAFDCFKLRFVCQKRRRSGGFVNIVVAPRTLSHMTFIPVMPGPCCCCCCYCCILCAYEHL